MSAGRQVALLRGINVGTAKRIAMADLREVFVGLGCSDVRTVLASGNVVHTPAGPLAAPAISAAVLAATGVDAAVLVVSGAALRAVAAADPLGEVATDPSRHLVTFLAAPVPAGVAVPAAADIAPDRLVVGDRAIYHWAPDGVLQSRVPAAYWRAVGGPEGGTARNWRTVQRLLALLD